MSAPCQAWAASIHSGAPAPEGRALSSQKDTEQGAGNVGAGSKAWQNLEMGLDFSLVSETLSMHGINSWPHMP